MSKSRYGTIENYQADLESVGQRAKYRESSLNSSDNVNENFGVSNPSRLNDQFDNGKFQNYVPLNVFNVDSFYLQGNLEFSENISLNYTKDEDKRTYNLEDTIDSVRDMPQRGAPNIRVSQRDLENPDNIRDPINLSARSTAYGIQYKINKNDNAGVIKRQKMSSYITSGIPIHRGGTINRLGKSDPTGYPYEYDIAERNESQSAIPSIEDRNSLLDRRKLEHAELDLKPAPGQPPRPPAPLPDL